MAIVATYILLASGTASAGRVPAPPEDTSVNYKIGDSDPHVFYMLLGQLPQAEYRLLPQVDN